MDISPLEPIDGRDPRDPVSPPLPTLVPRGDDADVDDLRGWDRIGLVVNWNHSPSFIDVSVLVDASRAVQPGQFLGVLHQRRGIRALTVIQVANSFEVNPNHAPELSAARRALGLEEHSAEEGISTRIFRLAECGTVEEFELSATGFSEIEGEGRSPVLLARAGDPVVVLPTDLIIAAIGGLPVPAGGLHLGQIPDTDGLNITLRPEALQYHMGIFGNPGKGKSYLAGNLLEEARMWNVPSLVIDVNGEFVKAARELGGRVITLPDKDRFGVSLDLLNPMELVAITPNVRLGTQYAELIESAQENLRARPQRPITFSMLRDEIKKIGESTKTSGSSVGAAIARVSTLEKDPIVNTSGFDFIKQIEEHGLVVLDCRYLSLRQTRLIAAMGARELQRIGRERARAAEEGNEDAADWFAILFMDEAHSVIPMDESVVSTHVFLELARMGRHARTGLVLSSQSPADLNPSVLKRLQLRFVFALERDQLRSIQGVVADLDEKILAQLPKLPIGTAAVSGSSELVRHGFLLKVRPRVTHVSGGTPTVFAAREKTTLRVDGSHDG